MKREAEQKEQEIKKAEFTKKNIEKEQQIKKVIEDKILVKDASVKEIQKKKCVRGDKNTASGVIG